MEYTRNEKNKHMSQKEFLYYLDLYRKGDREALNYLISEHIWVVQKIIEYFENQEKTDYNELYSAGVEYLWKAIERYDSSSTNPFIHYAFQIVRNRLYSVYKRNLPVDYIISFKDYEKEEENGNVVWDDDEFLNEGYLQGLVTSKLKNNYIQILNLYYKEGLTIDKVGNILGCSRAEISRILNLAINYLKYEMYDDGLIGNFEAEEYRKYKVYRHYNPENIYDLFINYQGKQLDTLLVDTILYFASPVNKSNLIKGLGLNYLNNINITDKEAYERALGTKSQMLQSLKSLTKEDVYNADPVQLTLLYLNKNASNISAYFRNMQTGEKLDERLVHFLIENNSSLKIYLQENGFNYSNYRISFINVYQWLRIKKFIPEFLDELQKTIGEDIFKLNVYEAIYKCEAALKQNHNFMRKLIVN